VSEAISPRRSETELASNFEKAFLAHRIIFGPVGKTEGPGRKGVESNLGWPGLLIDRSGVGAYDFC
jgi:hypothetical protein